MRKIDFQDITMSYFLSTGKGVSYSFDEGIHFIKGENKSVGQEGQNNGVGKTAIFFDSIVFALYGETSRKNFAKSSIPFNRGGKKNCVVILNLNLTEGGVVTKVEITRSINPSKLVLKVDGVDKTQSNAKSTQEYLVNTVLKGINKDVFMQSIAMKAGANSLFVMGKPEREKFIGTIFDFTYIKEAEKLAREEYNKLARDLQEKSANLSYREERLFNSKEQIKIAKKELDERVKKEEAKLKEIQDKIDLVELSTKPKEIDVQAEKEKCDKVIGKLGDEFNSVETERIDLERKIDELRKRETELEELIETKKTSKVCSECGQELDEEHRSNVDKECKKLQLELDSIPESIQNKHDKFLAVSGKKNLLGEKLKTVREGRDKIMDRAIKNKEKIANWQREKDHLTSLEDRAKELRESIATPSDSSVLKSLVKDFKTKTEEAKKLGEEIEDKEKDLQVLEQAKIVFSEKGLRSSILSKMINLFNASLNNYLSKFNAPCTIKFDEHMDYVIENLDGKEVEYESFSGGERWRINMSLVFTFSDVLRIQNQIGFNFKLFDEFFDGAVDKAGLEIISELLVQRQQAYGESAFIITHKTEFDIPEANIITVEKLNGQSKIV